MYNTTKKNALYHMVKKYCTFYI